MNITAAEVDQVAASVSSSSDYDIASADYELASAFRRRAGSNDPEDPWLVLANVFDIHLRPANANEPFGPKLVMDGKRSMVPTDLSDKQVELLSRLLQDVTNPSVRCRLGDVLWTARRDGRAGTDAVSAYMAAGTSLEDVKMWPPCMELYERGIRLARSLGRKGPLLTTALQHLGGRVAHHNGEDPSFFTCRALDLLNEFRFGDAGVLSGYALIAARRRTAANDPYSARAYWDIAAKLLARAGLSSAAEQARISSAQTWVAEADQAGETGNHGAAQAHFDSAIQAYRAIPCCKHLLPGLHRRLDAAGAEALKLMAPISTGPVDIEPLVRAAQESVQGLPLAEAIYAVACAAPTLEPDQMRSQALRDAERSPLASMLTRVMYDSAGRVVHKTPGLFTDDPDERERAIEAQVASRADLVRSFTVSAQIMPAAMALLAEHNIEQADIEALLGGSILIPEARRGLFALGIAAGFSRDFVTAMHLLVPQLEHALRVLLRDAGTITASIDQDGIQSEWPLGRLLSHEVIRPVLPDTLAFELRSLLIYKGSSNIRNRLCHGLLEPDEFGTANVVYIWWLLLKVSLHGTPGFSSWVDERFRSSTKTKQT